MRVLKKIGYQIKADPNDDKAKEIFNMFYNKSFSEVQGLYSRKFRILLSEAL